MFDLDFHCTRNRLIPEQVGDAASSVTSLRSRESGSRRRGRLLATSLVVASTFLGAPTLAQQASTWLLASETLLHRLPAGLRQGELRFGVDLGTQWLTVEIQTPLPNLLQSVRTPSGAVLTPDNAQAMGGGFVRFAQSANGLPSFPYGSANATVYRWTVPITQPGWVTLSFDNGVAVTEDTPVVAQTVSDSPTRLAMIPPPTQLAPGGPVALAVAVVSGSQPLRAADVQAVVMAGNRIESTLTLVDDGGEADGAAGDGIYSALYIPASDGIRTVVVTARAYVGGAAVTRQASASFDVRTAGARFSAVSPWGMFDSNGNGRKDLLMWSGQIHVSKPGRYGVAATLKSGQHMLRTQTVSERNSGFWPASLVFPTSRIEAEGVGAGRYIVDSIELQDLSGAGADVLDLTGTGTVVDLTGVVFDRKPLLLSGSARFFGSDPNSRGLWRKLVVEVEVDSTVADFITASTLLFSGTRTVATCSGTGYAKVGVSKVGINCIGRDIGSLGIDGPYEARELWAYRVNAGPPATLQVNGTFARSGPIRAAEFEGSDRRREDVNADGSVTCFDLSLVKADVGVRSADPAFDPRLDIDRDGVVTDADVELVRRALPAGVVCPGM